MYTYSLEHDWSSPVILIGAGRSGTTALASAIGEHPDFYMIGETAFLFPRLLEEFYRKSEYVNNYRLGKLFQLNDPRTARMLWFDYWQGILKRNLDNFHGDAKKILSNENKRIRELCGEFFGKSLVPPQLRAKFWGFKEIWNGSSAFRYDWDIYDDAFSNALYVHLIRNPFDFAISYIDLNNKELNREEYLNSLSEWTSIVSTCRERRDTGRYIEYKYEDFLSDPIFLLNKVFKYYGTGVSSCCLKALDLKYLQTRNKNLMPKLAIRDIRKINRFEALITELDYTIPDDMV